MMDENDAEAAEVTNNGHSSGNGNDDSPSTKRTSFEVERFQDEDDDDESSLDQFMRKDRHKEIMLGVAAVLFVMASVGTIYWSEGQSTEEVIEDTVDASSGHKGHDTVITGSSQLCVTDHPKNNKKKNNGGNNKKNQKNNNNNHHRSLSNGHKGQAPGEKKQAACRPWCENDKDTEKVCGWMDCTTCDFCQNDILVTEEEEETCPDWCNYRHEETQVCNFDWSTENCTSCACSTFVDVTMYKIPEVDSYFHHWMHSGKPYTHENGPIFVDLNGDGVYEFFDSMHGHPLMPNVTHPYGNRFDLTESVPFSFHKDGVKVPQEWLEEDTEGMYRYRHVSGRIHVVEEHTQTCDTHGQNILDLDGDGILDIMLSSGGSEGNLHEGSIFAQSRNNFLFWGKKGTDPITGRDDVTHFFGGRETSVDAGVAMLYGRGRVNYMMDINNDGKLDIFCMQLRPVGNMIIPGVMLINNGDRTWTEDESMMEYTDAMILTDVDGDGLAQEIILSRSYCYPQRKGPDVDPNYPDFGPYPTDVLQFCESRPVGTLVVFKYKGPHVGMKRLSPPEHTTAALKDQHGQCQHGQWANSHDCHARSMVTGDFDDDLKSDLVVLYETYFEIYLSTDNVMPKWKKEQMEKKGNYKPPLLGIEKEPSVTVNLPHDTCPKAGSIRLVDIDNDGRQELLIMCREHAGMFLLYTRGEDKDVWHLESPCSKDGALGDLTNATLHYPTMSDYGHLCSCLSKPFCEHWGIAANGCKYYKGEHEMPPATHGVAVTTIDMNNDGFIDLVTTSDFGYTRFFHNVPGLASRRYRYISFLLKGGTKAGNIYGIGAQVILYGERRFVKKAGSMPVRTPHHQFREKSSHQHASDISGGLEERIIFGLGLDIYPLNVTVRWSNGHVTTKSLKGWYFNKEKGNKEPIILGE